MEAEWPYLLNPFIIATANSKETFALVSTDTNASLSGPNGIPDLYTYYHGKHNDFMNAYDAWKAQIGTQQGATNTLNILLKGLPKAAYDWDYAIEGVYQKNTSQYKALMPNGRKPFYTGKQIARISAVSQLSIRLTGITALATVKTSVDAMLAALNAANLAQKHQKSQTETKAALLEEQRIIAGTGLYFVLSSLMAMFHETPERVKDYIPVDLLRKTKQTVFTGTVPPASIKLIAKRTLKPDTEITLKNPGSVDIKYYFAASKAGTLPPDVTPRTVPAGLSVKVPASTIGSPANTYLIVFNTSDVADAMFEVSI